MPYGRSRTDLDEKRTDAFEQRAGIADPPPVIVALEFEQAASGNGGGQPETPLRTPGLHRIVRHPLMFGFLLAFWATPHMTVGHLLLAAGMTAYITIGVHFEERALAGRFGAAYRACQRSTPMLIPWFRARYATSIVAADAQGRTHERRGDSVAPLY